MNNENAPEPKRSPLRRRTIVSGAAWTMPVAFVATAAPAYAASGPTVEFENPAITMEGCSSNGDVVVLATTNGTDPVPAGTPITVTLPEGFSFDDGSTSPATLTAGANGEVAVPAFSAPVGATEATLTAEYEGVTATATVTVTQVQGGDELYQGNTGYTSDFLPVPKTGLPEGAIFEQIYAADGSIYATLADGTIWRRGEETSLGNAPFDRTWYDTGLTGNVLDMLISSTQRSTSVVLHNGQLTGFYAGTRNIGDVAPGFAIDSPGNGDVVDIAVSHGSGALFAETSDGRLYVIRLYGAGTLGGWSEVTGFPTPLVDWTVTSGSGSEVVSVIGADGDLYSIQASVRPTTLRAYRNANATWEAPLVQFANPHTSASREFNVTSILFVDASGGLYSQSGGQNINYAGVLQGQLADKDIIITPSGYGAKTARLAYVISDNKFYVTNFTIPSEEAGFRDLTPPADLLAGSTIVDAHETANSAMFLYLEDGRVLLTAPMTTVGAEPNWTVATGVPEQSLEDPIIQDGKLAYILGGVTECA